MAVSEQFTYERADLLQPNAEVRRTVTSRDLPVACPPTDSYLWCSHPRIYLPVHETGEEACPYCGTVFTLEDEDDLAVATGGMREWK